MSCLIDCCLPTYYEEDMGLLDEGEGSVACVYNGRDVRRRNISGGAICTSILFVAGGAIFCSFGAVGQVLHNISWWQAGGFYIAGGAFLAASVGKLVVSRYFVKKN